MHDGKTLPVTRLTLMNYQLSAAKGVTSSPNFSKMYISHRSSGKVIKHMCCFLFSGGLSGLFFLYITGHFKWVKNYRVR